MKQFMVSPVASFWRYTEKADSYKIKGMVKKYKKNESWTDLQLDFKKLLIELVQNIICNSY